MKKLFDAASVFTGIVLFTAPAFAQGQQRPFDTYSAFGQGSGGVVMVEPRANVAGTPDSAFPYAAPHEIHYINGIPCRTILQDNGVRVPVACVMHSS